MTLKALIFDVDGTIAQTEKDGHRVAFNLAFESEGLPWRWDIEIYGKLLEIGGGKERLKHFITHYKPDLPQKQPLDSFIRHLHVKKSGYYAQLLADDRIPLRVGIKRLITSAHEMGIKLAIASTASVENVTVLLNTSLGEEMASWFEVIVAGDMVEKKKPAPDIYLLALKKLGFSCNECLVIEDTNQGLVASSEAGLKTVITINDYSKNQDFDRAVLVLNHLGEPDLPFEVIKGDSDNKSYFDLELAEKLLSIF